MTDLTGLVAARERARQRGDRGLFLELTFALRQRGWEPSAPEVEVPPAAAERATPPRARRRAI